MKLRYILEHRNNKKCSQIRKKIYYILAKTTFSYDEFKISKSILYNLNAQSKCSHSKVSNNLNML